MPDVERYLAGAHAVVTGASRGIGAAIADELARRGADVTLMARSAGALDERACALRERHRVRAAAVPCDVADETQVARAFGRAREALGEVTVLVNNAGLAESALLGETDRALWDATLATNLTGSYLCTTQVLPAMLAARHGRIVNVASTAGLRGYKRMTAYCAAKHGVVGLTRALALETARHGVTVNAVCPGYTETGMAERAMGNLVAALGIGAEEARTMLVRPIPRGMLTTPAEVAAAVAWLCAPEAAAVTGVALPVAGGEVT
ncbi:MAG TPA: SDR family NAD(P)-dependent oxidoreductase [Gemmatimonadaceae bacterium]|nr:SDR family NAD(P)-dependent oxidoreductase [Gemmatimonadaceae bacterium]